MKVRSLYNESDLLNSIANNDQQAFRLLFDNYRDKVYTYAFKLLHAEAAAEEVVQDIFLKIWINRAVLVEIENFGGYIRTITRNHTLNSLKKIARETIAFNDKNRDWTDADFDTENQIHYKDTQRMLLRAIDTLPPQQKLVYRMCKVDGMKQDEVAEKLSISPLTVKAHLKQAVKTVKSFMLLHTDIVSILLLLSSTRYK